MFDQWVKLGGRSFFIVIFIFSLLNGDTSGRAAANTIVYDFISSAPNASWRSGAGDLSFPGKDSDENGFVLYKQGAKLEDGSTAAMVLQTHPQWATNGWIKGTYSNITIPSGSELTIKVGFLSGAEGSDGVRYLVNMVDPVSKTHAILDLQKSYNGKLTTLTAGLNEYTGKTVNVELVVQAGASSGQDWATWIEAKIIQTEVQPQDSDGDGFLDDVDSCINQPETINDYQDNDGCPDTAPVINAVTPEPVDEAYAEIPNINWFVGVVEGPIMPGAFDDGDGDGVMNYQDECPNTPRDSGIPVYPNGCFCNDSDSGADVAALRQSGMIHLRYAGGESSYSDSCIDENTLREFSCNPLAETMVMPAESMWIASTVNCDAISSRSYGEHWSCESSRCVAEIQPEYCFSAGGTCSDGVQNQGEDGVDCGGICPPCNTMCTTGTRYAPDDTPCTSIFPDDPHEIELYWTDSWLEYPCRAYEICHPDLDYVIEEATQCCSIPNSYYGMNAAESQAAEQTAINAMPDPALCSAARELSSATGGCSRCVGLYIIKGLGDYARWMRGYTWLYPEHNVQGVGSSPAESLINNYQTGVCRDYSLAVTTLLRKAGYSQTSVGNYCDGHHCYNVVRLPGDLEWHLVDTTGNKVGIILSSVPGTYPYCTRMAESYICNEGVRSNGDACDGTETRIFDFPVLCEPGAPCGRDIFSTPGLAPTIDQVIGCR